MRDFWSCLRAALREVFKPAPFVDEDPQSTADATAARTAWVRAKRLGGGEVFRMKKDWDW
jgi:hypothetical protein